jgi:hypothetical protein
MLREPRRHGSLNKVNRSVSDAAEAGDSPKPRFLCYSRTVERPNAPLVLPQRCFPTAIRGQRSFTGQVVHNGEMGLQTF